jgi:tripartite-type tricarboxylate transporter receptor subunit TctC
LQELVTYAKARPGQVTYASQGLGSTAHLTAAYLAQVADIDLRHIPYRGAAPALTDVVAGHVTMTVDGLSSALGVIRGGTLRPLAVASRKRSPALPDVPTAIESGFPDFESASWYGVTVPNGTPALVIQILSKAISHALHEPDIMKDLVDRGADVVGSSPEELAAYMKEDTARWKKVIDDAKIKVE